VIEYPCGLPGVLRRGFGYTPKPVVVRTPIAQGPGVYTPHDSGGWMAFNVSWIYDTCDMQTFRNWFRRTIRGGALPFTIDLPIDGRDNYQHACYFDPASEYKAVQVGALWRVTATLLSPRVEGLLSECDAASLIAIMSSFCGPVDLDIKGGCFGAWISLQPSDQPVPACSIFSCNANYNYAVADGDITYYPLNDWQYYARPDTDPLRYAVTPFGGLTPEFHLRQSNNCTFDWAPDTNYWTKHILDPGSMAICNPPADGGGARGFMLELNYDKTPIVIPGSITGYMYWPGDQRNEGGSESISWHEHIHNSTSNTLPTYVSNVEYIVDYKHENGEQGPPLDFSFSMYENADGTITAGGETFNPNAIAYKNGHGRSFTVSWAMNISSNPSLDFVVYCNGVLGASGSIFDWFTPEPGSYDFQLRTPFDPINDSVILFQNLSIVVSAFFYSREPQDPDELYDVFQQQYLDYSDDNPNCIIFEEEA